jgi:hypothetical protein
VRDEWDTRYENRPVKTRIPEIMTTSLWLQIAFHSLSLRAWMSRRV